MLQRSFSEFCRTSKFSSLSTKLSCSSLLSTSHLIPSYSGHRTAFFNLQDQRRLSKRQIKFLSTQHYGDFHSHGGTPMAGWFLLGKSPLKWMITGGTPLSGNPHTISYSKYHQPPPPSTSSRSSTIIRQQGSSVPPLPRPSKYPQKCWLIQP